jgi:hypothetical protein
MTRGKYRVYDVLHGAGNLFFLLQIFQKPTSNFGCGLLMGQCLYGGTLSFIDKPQLMYIALLWLSSLIEGSKEKKKS